MAVFWYAAIMYIELHVPDFEIAKDFYRRFGFEVVWEKKPVDDKREWYLLIRNENNTIGFWPGNEEVYNQTYFKNFPKETKRGYGVEVVIELNNIEELYNKVKGQAKIVGELKVRHWGLKDFRVEDPFGFYLRFTEPHDPSKM